MSQKIAEERMKRNLQNRLGDLMKDLTQSYIEKKTGISRQNLAKYVTGQALPNSYTLYKLADFFGVSCDYLLGIDKGTTNDMEFIIKTTGLQEETIKILEDYNSMEDYKHEIFAINQLIKYSSATHFLIAFAKYVSSPNIEGEDFNDDIYANILPFIWPSETVSAIDSKVDDGEIYHEFIKIDDIIYHQLHREFNELLSKIKNDENTKKEWIAQLIDIMKDNYEDELYFLYKYEQEYEDSDIAVKDMNVNVKILKKVMDRYEKEKEIERRKRIEEYRTVDEFE